ncbi:hypothetical protein Tco_0818279 [Tanacetum coccineum]
MPLYMKKCKSSGSKKSRTSETTLHDTSDSTHIGLDLNDEAIDSEDEEVEEVRPIGWDMAKKKASSFVIRLESSIAGDQSLVDALMNKWSHVASPLFSQRQESGAEYLRIKERELESEKLKMENEERMEQMRLSQQRELEAQRIAQQRQQLEFERERYEWKKEAKKEKTSFSTLNPMSF